MTSSAETSIRSLSCLEPVPPPATDAAAKENLAPLHRNSINRRASSRSQVCSQPCLPSKREELGKCGGSNNCHKMRMVGTTMVYPRSTISPQITNNPATGLWIVTFNATTTGKAAQRAFSFQSEKEARAAAAANSSPVLIPFKNEPSCQICDANFTLFKRPRHCRNCGIVICSKFSCVAHWPKRMIPETFYTKKKNQSRVSVCTSCDIIAKRFHHSLICGQLDTAKELFETTRNINLRTPFVARSSSEDFFPIHSSIISGNVKLLRWLVDDQHCPLHMAEHSGVKSGTSGGVLQSLRDPHRQSSPRVFTPTIKTSKGRSVIDLAAETKNMDILTYLVSEKSVSVFELNNKELALGALEAAILAGKTTSCAPTEEAKVLPWVTHQKEIQSNFEKKLPMKTKCPERTDIVNLATIPLPPIQNRILVERDTHGHGGLYNRSGCDVESEEEERASLSDEESIATVVPDTCIVCSRAEVNCIAMPCGHQVCCSTCSGPLVSCPHCHDECYFLQTFHP